MQGDSFPFEAVLWDMDGTLIDSEPIWIDEEFQIMQSLGVDWSHDDAMHCLGGPISRVDQYMRERSGNMHQPLELSNILIENVEQRLKNGVNFTPGAENLLRTMFERGLPLALVTASNRSILDAALASIGSHFFHFTCSASDVENPKPDPEGYLKAADFLGVDIHNSLIIEDSKTGVTAAMHSGGYVLALPHMTELPTGPKVVHRKDLADLELRTLASLFQGIIAP